MASESKGGKKAGVPGRQGSRQVETLRSEVKVLARLVRRSGCPAGKMAGRRRR